VRIPQISAEATPADALRSLPFPSGPSGVRIKESRSSGQRGRTCRKGRRGEGGGGRAPRSPPPTSRGVGGLVEGPVSSCTWQERRGQVSHRLSLSPCRSHRCPDGGRLSLRSWASYLTSGGFDAAGHLVSRFLTAVLGIPGLKRALRRQKSQNVKRPLSHRSEGPFAASFCPRRRLTKQRQCSSGIGRKPLSFVRGTEAPSPLIEGFKSTAAQSSSEPFCAFSPP
jgi:hypothetical protein